MISILIPIYNVERYIGQCCQALFSQTYDRIEYVFVDDCSPDKSVDILLQTLEQYPQRKAQVKLLRHDCNRGSGAARATAIAAATGRFVMFADSDDLLPPDAVEQLADRQRQTEADIVDGAAVYFSSASPAAVIPQPVQSVSPFGNEAIAKSLRPTHFSSHSYLQLLLCHCRVSATVWGRLYRRSLFLRDDVCFREGIDYAEDQSIMPRLMYGSTRAWTDAVVYCYRNDAADSYTNRQLSDKSRQSYLRAMSEVYRFFLAHDRDGRYRLPLEIGMAGVYRECRRMRSPLSEADAIVAFCPVTLTGRLLMSVMRSRLPYRAADTAYRTVRLIYTLPIKLGTMGAVAKCGWWHIV